MRNLFLSVLLAVLYSYGNCQTAQIHFDLTGLNIKNAHLKILRFQPDSIDNYRTVVTIPVTASVFNYGLKITEPFFANFNLVLADSQVIRSGTYIVGNEKMTIKNDRDF